ncbi:MAG TPA: hypothetical protein VIS48_03675 [Candidatus Kryptonia bacterium]
MKILSMLIAILFFAPFPTKAQGLPSDSLQDEIVIDTVYVLTINDTMPNYSFHYMAYRGEWLKIVVSDVETGDTIQTIEDDFGVSSDQSEYVEPLWMMDLNYDGYGDLMLLTGMHQILGRSSYSYWLYNPKIGRFGRDERMSSQLNDEPEFDLTNRTVKTFSVDYPGTFNREDDTYKFINGSYVLIRRLKCSVQANPEREGNTQWIWSLEELSSGKLKMVKKHIGPAMPAWAKELE